MLPFLSMVSASILAGSMVLASDLIIQGFPRFTAVAIRFAISSSVLVPIALARGEVARLPLRDWGLLTFQATAGTVGFMLFFLQGVHLAGPVNAGIVAGLLPALVALTGFLLLKEQIKSREKAAILCASIGLMALTADQNGQASRLNEGTQFLGLVCLVLAYWGDAIFTVLSKRLSKPVKPTFIAASLSAIGFLLALGPAVAETILYGWPQASSSSWLALFWFAVGPTIMSFLLWYWGVERSTAATAGIAIAAMPPSAVFFSWGVPDAPVSIAQALALSLVILGLLLALTQMKDGETTDLTAASTDDR